MNPMTHALFPIDLNGGNQRLLANAAEKQSIRVQMGRRTCVKCSKESPFILCHHRLIDADGIERIGETCGGRTKCANQKTRNVVEEGRFRPFDWIP